MLDNLTDEQQQEFVEKSIQEETETLIRLTGNSPQAKIY